MARQHRIDERAFVHRKALIGGLVLFALIASAAVYAVMPQVCPIMVYEMSKSLEDLGTTPDGFRGFFVTVDAECDTADRLGDYLSHFDPRMEGLVPTIEQLPKLSAAYRIYDIKVPTSDGSYTMDRWALVYLFDRDGHYAEHISCGASAAVRGEKLKQLLASN